MATVALQKRQCDLGGSAPARSSVEAATTLAASVGQCACNILINKEIKKSSKKNKNEIKKSIFAN